MRFNRIILGIFIVLIASLLVWFSYNWGLLGGPVKIRSQLFSAIWSGDTNNVAKLIRVADVNHPSDQLGHPTPLMDAVKFGQIMIVKMLFESGADPNKKDSDGHSAIYYALQPTPFLDPKESDSVKICEILIAHHANLSGLGISNAVHNLGYDDPRGQVYREATE